MPTDFAQPSQKKPVRHFTHQDFLDGKCDENGIAKGGTVMEEDKQEAPAEETPQTAAPAEETPKEEAPAEAPAEPEAEAPAEEGGDDAPKEGE